MRAYLSNMPDRPGISALKQLDLSLGWIDGKCDSTVALPLPVECAEVPPAARFGQNYPAFANVAVGDEDFYFTAQADQTAIVDARRFHAADGKRLASMLKVEADQSVVDLQTKVSVVHSTVCAQPYVRRTCPRAVGSC